MTTLAIVQARMGSTRLPGKVMRSIGGRPLIELLLARLSRARRLERIVVATPDLAADDGLADHVIRLGYDVFRGSPLDVLDRYYQAALRYEPDSVVRITADCPLIDPDLVDEVVDAYQRQSVDYLTTVGYPVGLDTEIFSFQALERSASDACTPAEREHVTPYMRESGVCTAASYACADDLSAERWTVDEAVDLDVVAAIAGHFSPRIDFGWREVLALSRQRPELFEANRHLVKRPQPGTAGQTATQAKS